MTRPTSPPAVGSQPMSSPPRPPDAAAHAFLSALLRSKLLPTERVMEAVGGLAVADRQDARKLADALVAAGDLTHYQADKLLLGLWQGLALGPYRVLAPLGRGGMGTVYLARDGIGGGLVALKVLPPQRAKAEGRTLARFRREMELGKHLSHPNVTRTLDAGVAGGVHYIAMEYVPGLSLRQTVVRGGPLTVADAARVFADVCAGLAHAHGRGLIHRDLKPPNIMVIPDGVAKVLDLGLALIVGEELPADPSIVGGAGYVLGTMDYIAPEQAADATAVGPRSDLYAVGCSLYYALTGVPPFPGGTPQQKLKWHRSELPPPVASLNPTVPSGFAAIVDALLAKRPEDRPASADAVRAMLLPWAGDHVTRSAGADHAPHTDREAVAEVDTRSLDPTLWDAGPVVEAELLPAEAVEPLPLDWADAPPPRRRRWPAVLSAAMAAVGLLVAGLLLFRAR